MRASLLAQMVKNLQGNSPEKGNGRHSSILVWKIPWTEETAVLQSRGLQRVGRN